MAWADKPVAGKVLGIPAATAKAVREAAAKFVEWLKVGDEGSGGVRLAHLAMANCGIVLVIVQLNTARMPSLHACLGRASY